MRIHKPAVAPSEQTNKAGLSTERPKRSTKLSCRTAPRKALSLAQTLVRSSSAAAYSYRLFFLCVLCLFAAACGSSKGPETPEDRAALFINALMSQNATAFWDSLDQPSQEGISKLAGLDPKAADAPQKALALAGRWKAITALKPIRPDIHPDPNKATVIIESLAGEKMPLELVKDGDRWRVHLPLEDLGKAPAQSAPASAPSSSPASAATSAPASASAPTSSPATKTAQ